jgi:hypothetical protein
MLTKHESSTTGKETRYLRKCVGEKRRDRIRNSQIRGILNQQPVTKTVKRKDLRWFGHLSRMDSNMKPRQVWETRVKGTQGRGRPSIEWEQHMQIIMSRKGKTLQEVLGW